MLDTDDIICIVIINTHIVICPGPKYDSAVLSVEWKIEHEKSTGKREKHGIVEFHYGSSTLGNRIDLNVKQSSDLFIFHYQAESEHN